MNFERLPSPESMTPRQEPNHMEAYDRLLENTGQLEEPIIVAEHTVEPAASMAESSEMVEQRIEDARAIVERVRDSNLNLSPEEKRTKAAEGFDDIVAEHNEFVRSNGGKAGMTYRMKDQKTKITYLTWLPLFWYDNDMLETPSNPNREFSPLMGIPILTQEEVIALHENPDNGIIRAEIKQFEKYEDWQTRTSDSTWGLGFFLQGVMYDTYKELQCVQRYTELYPEEHGEVVAQVNSVHPSLTREEVTDRLVWQAYEKLASLVDVNDAKLKRTPDGDIDPRSLLI